MGKTLLVAAAAGGAAIGGNWGGGKLTDAIDQSRVKASKTPLNSGLTTAIEIGIAIAAAALTGLIVSYIVK